MRKKLTQDCYAAPTLNVARDLLGKYLVKRGDGGLRVGRIVETEAYCGPDDKASHARWGPTRRARIMFGPAGFWYVYLIYGAYNCLNITSDNDGYPAAILLRAVTPVSGLPEGAKTDGPGKLCRAYGIDRSLNTKPAFGREAEVWIEDRGDTLSPESIAATPRIGVHYAGEYADKPWRFILRK